jgi:sugar diacid utilization regulator
MSVPTRGGGEPSEALACADLTRLSRAELVGLISDEAVERLGAGEAVAWVFQARLGRLFYDRQGAEPVSVVISSSLVADLLAGSASWEEDDELVWARLVEASFGVSIARRNASVVVLPLIAADELLGLLVLREPAVEQGRFEAFARQTAAALRTHRSLRGAMRNESQLQALFETASEVSSNLDIETVLAAIVERARMVIHAPVAYVMFVDQEAGDIAMRVTAGTMSPEFAALRLPLGRGLGGQVAAGQQTLYTSDYLDDERFAHSPQIDDAVRYEGIRSILGAPMSVSGRYVGVLFVADRRVRIYEEADASLLTSLAHHAGTAIHNAELYDQARKAAEDLTKINEVVRAQNLRLQRGEALHEQLSRAILEGQALADIVGLIAAETGGQVIVFDEHHRLLASAHEPADSFGRRLLEESVERAAGRIGELRDVLDGRAVETAVLGAAPPARSAARLVVPIVARAEFLGSVWAEWPSDTTAEGRHLVEQAARVVALELLKERAVAEVHRRLGRELLDDLLAPHATLDAGLERRGVELGVDLTLPHRIVRVTSTGAADSDAATLARRANDTLIAALRRQPWCKFAATYDRSVVALAISEHDDITATLEALLLEHAKAAGRMRAVVSQPCERVGDYASQFSAAGRALQLLGDGRSVSIMDLNEAWGLTLLFRSGNDQEIRRFIDAQLAPVLEYDASHGLNLAETLEVYLDNERSPTKTATALHMHVNSVYYRLSRLKELLGPSLTSQQRALDVRIALVAHRLFQQGDRDLD